MGQNKSAQAGAAFRRSPQGFADSVHGRTIGKSCQGRRTGQRKRNPRFQKIFDITAGSNDKLARIFNEAKQTADNFEPYAFQLRLLAKDDLNLQESIVENLFKIAVADGRFGDAELGIIRSVATIIELPDGNFEAIRQNFEIRTQASSLNDCYQVLGVFCNASNCEIKRRWKELINQYHPDRAQANGADRGTIEAYTLKMAEINNAYQNIMKSRKTI